MRSVAVVIALVGGLAACGSSHHGAGHRTTTTPARPPTTTTTPGTGFSGGGTADVTAAGTRGLLTGVEIGAHPGFDRVVFTFEEGVPGYRAGYITRPVQEDASGKEITVAGDSVLRVRMEPASGADLSGGQVRQTYTGPKRVAGNGTVAVVEAVDAGDFESVLTWVIGVKGHPAFKVTTLADPSRIVVDVAAS